MELKETIVEKTIDENKSDESKKVYQHYLVERKETMKNTQSKVGDVFGDRLGKESPSPGHVTKCNIVSAEIL